LLERFGMIAVSHRGAWRGRWQVPHPRQESAGAHGVAARTLWQ
jgi:hypothetical protein